MTVAQRFGSFVAAAASYAIPDEVNWHSVRALVDWTGVAIAGWEPGPAAMVASALSDELGHGACQLLRHGNQAAPARLAALLNGTASHVVELDDIYAPGLYHPGSPTIASALASAQMSGADGRTLLAAIAIGYQVGNAVAKAIQPSHYHHWHTTGTAGCFGAAAAAAVCLGLKADESAHALATSATMAAGLQQAFRSDSMSKPLHAGRAAETGVFAALCAAKGLTGEKHMFEGPQGFGQVMSANVDWGAALEDVLGPWTVAESTHKIHACCGHAFAAIDGALALRDGVRDTLIQHIRIETYTTAIEVAGIARPATPFEAKFSIPFTVATALQYGKVGLEAFSDARLGNEDLRGLAEKTEIVASTHFDTEYPTLRNARTIITLADGRVLDHHQPTRRGSPTYPLNDLELFDKFHRLVSPAVGAEASEALLAQLTTIKTGNSCYLNLPATPAKGMVPVQASLQNIKR